MTDSPDQPEAPKTLAEILLDKNLLSLAQIELAIADQDINDIPLEEILLVRGWITQEKLYEIAPWLKPGSKLPAPPVSKSGSFPKVGSGKPGGSRATGSVAKPDLSKLAAMKPNTESGVASGSGSASSGGKEGAASSAPAATAAASTTSSASSTTSSASSTTSSVPSKEPVSAVARTAESSDKAAAGASSEKPQATAASDSAKSMVTAAETQKTAEPAKAPVSTAGGDDLNKSQDIPLVAGTVSGGAKKNTGERTIEPPATATGTPVVHLSPVKSDSEQNLKTYKEVLKKILALDKD